jgi:16S rRNA (uracil1498-N3)-methyltransferase
MPSFFCPGLNKNQNTITLSGEEYHHLAHVLRHKPGDEIRLNSGDGWLGKGVVNSISKTQAIVGVTDASYTETSSTAFAIAFSLLRNKNDEWMVEKATELGVADLFPFQSRYSIRNPSSNTLKRFRQASLAAIKQCDNPFLPAVHDIVSLDVLLSLIQQGGYHAVLASEHRPDLWLDSLEQGIPYCFIIGPEGGFSPDELAMIKHSGAREISLSKLVLRAETAALTAAAQFTMLNRKII